MLLRVGCPILHATRPPSCSSVCSRVPTRETRQKRCVVCWSGLLFPSDFAVKCIDADMRRRRRRTLSRRPSANVRSVARALCSARNRARSSRSALAKFAPRASRLLLPRPLLPLPLLRGSSGGGAPVARRRPPSRASPLLLLGRSSSTGGGGVTSLCGAPSSRWRLDGHEAASPARARAHRASSARRSPIVSSCRREHL